MATQGIQLWTVPTTGNYTLTLAGASGGDANGVPGGLGRIIISTVSLTQGGVLQILVGQHGGVLSASDKSGMFAGAGGGGSFVADSGNSAIIVAGGGGGASSGNNGGTTFRLNGGDANVLRGSNGTFGSFGTLEYPNDGGAGGDTGAGGEAWKYNDDPHHGGSGGGGFDGNGIEGTYGGFPGLSFLNGSSGGGNIQYTSLTVLDDIPGGFGGGAGAGLNSGYEVDAGGGGGYSGGGGGHRDEGSGGGGGNYVSGFNSLDGGLNYGDGYVTLVFASI